MNHKIASTMILRNGAFVGWMVYIDGKKYPKKPQVMYAGILEYKALRLAFKEAGLDPDTVKDIINSEIDIPDLQDSAIPPEELRRMAKT